MKTFDIYVKDNNKQAVKQGFSWPAFLVAPFWALAKGLRKYTVIAFAIMFAINYGVKYLLAQTMHMSFSQVNAQAHAMTSNPSAASGIYHIIHLVLLLAMMITFGVIGNKLVRNKLETQGFKKTKTVQASSIKEATREQALSS